MWGMEYNPNIFAKYEDPDGAKSKPVTAAVNNKVLKQYGKFERNTLKTGHTEENSALAIFLVASVLETKNKRILTEAKGVDDVVKVLTLSLNPLLFMFLHMFSAFISRKTISSDFG
jgi:hypothetical protein